jgi:hypothetical protein
VLHLFNAPRQMFLARQVVDALRQQVQGSQELNSLAPPVFQRRELRLPNAMRTVGVP